MSNKLLQEKSVLPIKAYDVQYILYFVSSHLIFFHTISGYDSVTRNILLLFEGELQQL